MFGVVAQNASRENTKPTVASVREVACLLDKPLPLGSLGRCTPGDKGEVCENRLDSIWWKLQKASGTQAEKAAGIGGPRLLLASDSPARLP
jgi:hypothetical protein